MDHNKQGVISSEFFATVREKTEDKLTKIVEDVFNQFKTTFWGKIFLIKKNTIIFYVSLLCIFLLTIAIYIISFFILIHSNTNNGNAFFILSIVVFVLFFSTIFVFGFSLKAKKRFFDNIKREILKNETEFYKIIFNSIDNFKVKTIDNSLSLLEMDTYARYMSFGADIPLYAVVTNSSNVFMGEYKGNPFRFQIKTWFWEKKENVFSERHIGWIEMELVNSEKVQDLVFTIIENFERIRLIKETFENKDFNKQFGVQGNDSLLLRMLFTPLTMEQMLEWKNENLKFAPFAISKIGNKIKIPFRAIPGQLSLDFNSRKARKVDTIVASLIYDLFRDTYPIYCLFHLLDLAPYLINKPKED